jgi:ring-1,2-phenylacetyl-CoA epoxidase subunit PaaD
VRDVVATPDGVLVTITPTYSGCPAMREMEDDIRRALRDAGVGPVEVKTVLSPAWTTDWIGPEARAKLEAYGIAPPAARGGELVTLARRATPIRCPYCKSNRTQRQSEFGSTACKAIWTCLDCRQPFEEFKSI